MASQTRIKQLQDEREAIQKKTFTKWINSHLKRVGVHVSDLYKDLCDGRVLLQLLHILSGEDLGPVSRGRLRINQLENVDKALKFLKEKHVNMPSTGPADIVDGNHRLILGLMWIIILRFQIQDIRLEDDPESRSANEALLLWCKRKTAGYDGVDVTNFTSSWKDGLAFNALIHKHRPDLINFESLSSKNAAQNLSQAFKVAETELGIAPLLDVEDLSMPNPDDKSVMTYLVSYYHYFSRMKAEETGGRKLNKLIGFLVEVDEMQEDYEKLFSNLKDWIDKTIVKLGDRNFPNTLDGMQHLMAQFKQYRTEEKPPKHNERTILEIKLFDIQMKYRGSKQKTWHPSDGKLVSDLNRLWIGLEGAEHEREAALRKELIRQEKLERLAERFEKKTALRESWLNEMIKVLTNLETQADLKAVDSALKRHEAVSAEISAGESRMDSVKTLSTDLISERYHNFEAIKARCEQLFIDWESLLEKLKICGDILSTTHHLIAIFTEIDDCLGTMEEMKKLLESDEYGKHLLGVQDLIKKHHLVEMDMVTLIEKANDLKKKAMGFVDSSPTENQVIEAKLSSINSTCVALKHQAEYRLEKLQESESLHKFMLQVEEEEAWVKEKEAIASSMEFGKDLNAVLHSQQKHQALEIEVLGRNDHFKSLCEKGRNLKVSMQSTMDSPSMSAPKQKTDLTAQARVIQNRVVVLQEKWDKLNDLISARRTRLEESIQSQQYHADANEAESWIKERNPLVSSNDYGTNESSAKGLLQNHERLQGEIKGYSSEIERLKELSKKVASSASTTATFETSNDPPTIDSVAEEKEVEMVMEYEEEIMEKKEVEKEVEVQKNIPRVKAIYKHNGQGMGFEKGEVFVLISKANSDWWSVKRGNGQQGYVPANYVKEIEPAIITQKVTKTVVEEVPVVRKKTEMVKKRAKPPNRWRKATRTFSLYGGYSQLKSEGQNVASRQKSINSSYDALVKQAEDRHKKLLDSIKLFKLCSECEEVETWVKEKEAVFEAKEKGTTKEQLDSIQKKYDTLVSEMQANTPRLQEIENEVETLLKGNHPAVDMINDRHQQLQKRWRTLQSLKDKKEESLAATKEVYEFDQMCDETKAWMSEKDYLLSNDETGRDLNDLQMLKRRHQAIERELVPIDERIEKLNKLGNTASQSSPHDSRHIQSCISDLNTMWDKVKEKNQARKAQLDSAQQLHSFMADSRDLLGWASESLAILGSDELPQNVQAAEEMIQTHQELKQEILNKEQQFEGLQSLGRKVTASDEVKDRLQQMSQELAGLKDSWEKRNRELKQNNELQLLLRDAEALESVTASQEAFLANDDLGSTIDEVSALIRKHEDFEVSCQSHDDKIKQLSDQANKLIHAGHYDIPKIAERRDAVTNRRQKVKACALDRSKKLQASLGWHQFCSDADEVGTWINEKMQSATDESYKEATNIDNKIQKHQAFDAEITANKGRADAVCKMGNDLMAANHYKSADIKKKVQQLSDDWKKLAAASTDKGMKLKQALDCQILQRGADEEMTWCTEVKKQLDSEDIGKDLQSVRFLIEKTKQLESDMQTHKEHVASLCTTASKQAASGHFEAAKILELKDKLSDCFSSLQEPLKDRQSQLEESLELQQFFRDAEDEMHWIKEHKPLATSDDVGKSLQEVQNLTKKHQSLLHEINAHEPNIDQVKARAEQLINANHFGSEEIQFQLLQLQSSWRDLKLQSAKRTQKLSDSEESQKFFQEAGEADVWMNDRAGLAASQDFGRDEDAAVKLLKKHKDLQEDVDGYVETVEKLGKTAINLLQKDHFDSANITARKSQLDEQLAGLQMLAANRSSKLEESIKLHQYINDVDDVISWLNEKASLAVVDDFGKDFDHLMVLQKKFDEFKRDIAAGSDRYTSVNKLARQLVAEGHSDTVMIKEKQDQMRDGWSSLQDAIQVKGKKFAGAYEVHKFIRDAKDTLMRIKDKETSIPVDDLGKSIQSVLALQRKMETFEREVAALGTKARDLGNECIQLCSSHPGQSAEKVSEAMEEVQNAYEQLQAATLNRKRKLKSSLELQKLLLSINDLVSWMKDTSAQITGEPPVTSVSSAKELLDSHNQVKAEIDARTDSIQKLSRSANKLVQQGHYAKAEIQTNLANLREELSHLHGAWTAQQDLLEEKLQYHMFIQDVDNLEALCATHEVQLLQDTLGESIDQCEVLLKKHEAFERLIASQNEKVTQVCDFGDQLCLQNHVESDNIRGRKNGLKERRQKVKKTAQLRRNRLEDCRKYMVFLQDVMEAQAWIRDKLQIATDESFHDPTNLDNKKKKHSEFEAEVNANEQRIQSIAQVGEDLVESGHYASAEIEVHVETLFNEWGELQTATIAKTQGIKEALSFQQFKRKVDAVLVLIEEKTAIASIKDTGQDLDHCHTLMKKFNDFQKELSVEQSDVRSLNTLARSLICDNHTAKEMIEGMQSDVNASWSKLEELVQERTRILADAEQIHSFISEASEINDRMNEKAKSLNTQDYGKDLEGVQSLLMRHQELENDLTAIEDKLELLDQESQRLTEIQPSCEEIIQEKLEEIIENWEELTKNADTRRTTLTESLNYQKFLAELRDLLAWMNDITKRNLSDELARGVVEADAVLQNHRERKNEMEQREETFETITNTGKQLMEEEHFASEEISSGLKSLDSEHKKLWETWKQREHLFLQCKELQILLKSAEQRDAWIGTQEAYLANENLGDSLSSVESLIRKHEDFVKSLKNQEGKLEQLREHAAKLLSEDHYESPAIVTRRDAVFTRYSRLKQQSTQRMRKLHDSKKMQLFLQEVTEVETWIAEKLQIASEESYLQMTDLQSKLQMHDAFQAELKANQKRVDDVVQNGNELVEANHYASHQIEACVDSLKINWRSLDEKSADKFLKLTQARELQIFEQEAEDIIGWISDMEKQLASRDLGRDLISVNNLIKEHNMIEDEIQAHQDQIDNIQAQVRRFVEANHFMIERIEDLGRQLVNRFCELEDPMSQRIQQLNSSLQFQTFVHDVEEELNWIKEREHQSSSTDLGSNLSGVQQLAKKHRSLVDELKGHEERVSTLLSEGEDLAFEHFAASEINDRLKKLHEAWMALNKQALQRSSDLDDSLLLQQFYMKCTEAESWMKDKKPLVSSEEYGKDEDNTVTLIKKHEMVQLELDSYQSRITDIKDSGSEMTTVGHYASADIAAKQSQVESFYNELLSLAQHRHLRLKETKLLHEFDRECDEVSKWIKEKEMVACSEETGRDLEHVETILKRFTDFSNFLGSSGEKIEKINQVALSLLQDEHTESAYIEKRKSMINAQWEELRRKTDKRQINLEAAKEIHIFNRDANDALQRIKEKEKAVSGEDYGKDLSSVQALQKRHSGFEHDLAPLVKRVEQLSKEAVRLQKSQPKAAGDIKAKEGGVNSAWEQLKQKSKLRKKKLEQAFELHCYLDDFRDLNLWLNDMKLVILADEPPHDIAAAEELLQHLSEYKTEIDGHKQAFAAFQKQGKTLINAKHYAKEEISEKMKLMQSLQKDIVDLWNQKKEEYEEHLDLQKFKHDAENADSWIAAQEAFFKSIDHTDSLDAVEEMIKKQNELENMLKRQEERFKQLKKETMPEKLERERREEEERKLQEEREAKKKEERKRLEEIRKKEEEEQRRQELKRLEEERERKRIEDEKRRQEEQEQLERKKAEEEKALKIPPKKPPQLDLSVTTASVPQLPKSESTVSGFYNIPRSSKETVYKEGNLLRKNELDEGGRKASVRASKPYYAVLSGAKLHFYKDSSDIASKNEAVPPINITLGSCQMAKDAKKKHAFRLTLPNGAEYLFVADDDNDALSWIACINNAVQTASHIYETMSDVQSQQPLDQHQLASSSAKKPQTMAASTTSDSRQLPSSQSKAAPHIKEQPPVQVEEKKKRRFTLSKKKT